jgi:hypothetical protein
MQLFKHPDNKGLYQIHGLTEDHLIGLYYVAVSMKGYVSQLLAMSPASLKMVAGNVDLKTFKESLQTQFKAASDYIEFWEEAINKNDKPEAKQQN